VVHSSQSYPLVPCINFSLYNLMLISFPFSLVQSSDLLLSLLQGHLVLLGQSHSRQLAFNVISMPGGNCELSGELSCRTLSAYPGLTARFALTWLSLAWYKPALDAASFKNPQRS
jgi:hypothetical protein